VARAEVAEAVEDLPYAVAWFEDADEPLTAVADLDER
jgi:hypothetical protein